MGYAKNSSPKFAHSTHNAQKNVEQIDKEISQDIVCELKCDFYVHVGRKFCTKQEKKTTISNTT